MYLDKLYLSDIKSGFFVFLIALPLCLGIAAASGFPPISGVFTAIIGGIISSLFGSSRLTIKGPAAGLIVICLGAVQELGQGDMALGYRRALAVGVAAAIIQIVLSLLKAGKFGTLMPPAVIHGLLAGIGVIIFSKQLHTMLGVIPVSKTPFQLISELPHSILNEDPFIAILGLITIAGLILFPKLKFLNQLPAALLDLLIVVPLGLAMHLTVPHRANLFGHYYDLGPDFLVHIPAQAFTSITFPDWSALTFLGGWKYVVMFALVGSIESILTVSAVDSLDPERQQSNLDRDLFSTGVGNLLSSLIGGLPMISEIVRSKANIDNKAKGVSSNIFHGVFLLLAISLFPKIINLIPLSSLAAMLVMTGFRLASPKEFLKTYRLGIDQLLIFVATLVVTLASNLLVGVVVGIILKIVIHILRGVQPAHFFKLEIQTIQVSPNEVTIQPIGPCIFLNLNHLQTSIQSALKKYKVVNIDLSRSTLVDHTTLERLNTLSHTTSTATLKIKGLDLLKGVSSHELATRYLT